MNSIVDFLKKNDSMTEGLNFFYGSGHEVFISYHDFMNRAKMVLGYLQNMGMREGEEVVFQIEDPQKFLTLFWGCVMGKLIPVPVLVGNNDEHKRKIIKIWETLQSPYLAMTEDIVDRLKADLQRLSPECSLVRDFDRRAFTVEEAMKSEKPGICSEIEEDDLCFIQFSSGSTGDPKGVMLTHKNLMTNTKDIVNDSGLRKDDRILNWMPLTHDMGLIGCNLSPTRIGATQTVMATSLFARKPVLWLELIEKEKITVSCLPNFGCRLILKYWQRQKRKRPDADYDLSSLRLLFNGAEPISYALETEFLNEFEKHHMNKKCMMNVYGMAEASLAVCFPIPGAEIEPYYVKRESLKIGQTVAIENNASASTVTLVDVGSPIGDLAMKIVDDDGKKLGENQVGYIWIKGENVTKGYYHNENITAETITEDGYLKTGDVGFVTDGKLIVTGRAKDIIFINGQNYYPPDLERVCEGIDSIELNTVAACGVRPNGAENDQIAIFILSSASMDQFSVTAWKVKQTLLKTMGIDADYFVPIHKMPKTTSGKLQRYVLGRKLEAGEYNDIIDAVNRKLSERRERTLSEIKMRHFHTKTEAKLFEICAEFVDMSGADTTNNFSQLGFTSMTMVKVSEKIKSEFGKRIVAADLYAYPTIEKLAHLIENDSSIVIRKNRFKARLVDYRNDEPSPLEFEFEGGQDADDRIESFLESAIDGDLAVVYEENSAGVDCVEICKGRRTVIETVTAESMETARIDYHEKGFSILIVRDREPGDINQYFDIIIEVIKARYGEITLFVFNNNALRAERICEAL
ncbi:MAG: AMP-binding protein [Clostridiales bacterium]|nr:AMP-binding protein [Clostridiales bacterium]